MSAAAALCCIGCNGLSLSLGGRDHTIVDDAGRSWFFEMPPYCGPMVLRKDGPSRPTLAATPQAKNRLPIFRT